VLVREAGLAQATVQQGSAAIADALHARLGGDWATLAAHLEDARLAADKKLAVRSALALVRALCDDAEQVRSRLRPSPGIVADKPSAPTPAKV
jgi:hypothetical protein